jgi:TRAP-type transport system periplasmic protein
VSEWILRSGLATALAAFIGSASVAETVSYGSWAPESHPNSMSTIAFFDRVSKDTKGSLKFESHYDGTLVNLRTSLPGVRDGLVDAAYVNGVVFTRDLPTEFMFADHATLNGDGRAVSAAMTEMLLLNCPECRKEATATGIVPLAYVADAPFYLICDKQVKDLSFFPGKQIRGVAAFAALVQKLGATPVNTATTEVYEAMQRGAVTCTVGGGFWLRTYNLWDVATQVLDLKLGQQNNGSLLAFGRDTWRRLSDEHRKAILKNLPFLVSTASFIHREQDKEVRAASKAHGVTWYAPPADFADAVNKFRSSDIDRLISAAEKQGVARPKELWDRFMPLLKKWEGIVAESGDNREKFESALQREIYSRFDPMKQ